MSQITQQMINDGYEVPVVNSGALPVSKEQATAWIRLAEAKNQTVKELQGMELKAQSLLVESKDYAIIDASLASYRKLHTDMIEHRKNFTSVIENNLIQPLMAFEKRVDPKVNETYQNLITRSLTLRKEESEKANQANAKNQEISSFKAHVVNEFSRVVTEYRAMIRREFTNHYNLMLREKVQDPALSKIKIFLSEMTAPQVAKFKANYLSNEELMELYSEIAKPDYNDILAGLLDEVDTLFSNYSSDLANAEAAIKHQQDAAKLLELEEANKAKEEQALNTLIATSETVIIDEPKIKRTLHITLVESWAWGKAVMAAFIINEQALAKYIKVKKVSSLNIGQMAAYLSQYATDENVTFKGLELKEIEK